MKHKYLKDQHVEAYYDDGWYPGVIHALNDNGTYYVFFDDGDILEDMADDEIRVPVMINSAEDDENEYDTFVEATTYVTEKEEIASTAPVQTILSKVENFLLPKSKSLRSNTLSELPHDRLRRILKEITILEHLRLMQFLYRDNDDELQVAREIRGPEQLRVSNKVLVENIYEGRTRIVALCRMCYGDESVEYVRALVDLANIYAVQGLWDQVSDQMCLASQKLLILSRRKPNISRPFISAEFVQSVFTTLRQHTMQLRGYVSSAFITELSSILHSILEKQANSVDYIDPNGMATLFYTNAISELTIELETFMKHYDGKRVGRYQSSERSPQKYAQQLIYIPWGAVCNFLQQESKAMQKWYHSMETLLLPHNTSILEIAFSVGDIKHRHVCHPVELSINLSKFPAAVRIFSGTTVLQDLLKYQHDISLYIDTLTNDLIEMANDNEMKEVFLSQPNSNRQLVKYELPVTWYEFLSLTILHTSDFDQFELLRVQLLNLLGLSNVFTNKIPLAEENMRNALGILETLGLDMDLTSVDLYNSISQLMVVKHRQWHAHKKERCEKEAKAWLNSKGGRNALKDEVKEIRLEYDQKKLFRISHDSAESKAYDRLLKRQARHLMKIEVDPTLPSLEAAYRYLVRSFEILEKAHGSRHAIVATASLAVASVQNVIGNHAESKEWLVRAIRTMEKINPLPVRAIAFTQTQLSSVLIKLKHPKSAVKVLAAAVSFYHSCSMQRLVCRPRVYISSVNAFSTQARGQQVMEDIETTLTLMRRLMMLNDDIGSKWQASEYADNMAELSDATYGWDSREAADSRKLAAEKQCAVQDWGRATGNFKKAIDAHIVVYGEADKRTKGVKGQLQRAQKNRDDDMINSVPDIDAANDDNSLASDEIRR